MATHPRCSTREGSSCSRQWFGDHSKGVWEIVRKKEHTTYLLDDKHGGGKGLLTALWMLSRGEQNWIESSQRAYRWSTDGGEHTEREGKGYRYVSMQYECVKTGSPQVLLGGPGGQGIRVEVSPDTSRA